jgi:hypothetical protein
VEVLAGLRGALMLARGRAEGIMLMPLTAEAARRAYWAAVFCLPIFLAVRLLSGVTPLTARGITAEIIGFVVSWAGYSLATLPMVVATGHGALWPRFLATWNWVSLVQYLFIVPISLLASLLPGWLGQGVNLAGLGYLLWLQWFATGLSLRLGGALAAGLVLLDLILGSVVSSFASGLSGG